MLLTDYLKRFDLYLQIAGAAKNTKASYARTLKRFAQYLEYGNGPEEMQQIQTAHIREFLAACENCGERPATVLVRLLTLKKFFGWLKKEGEIVQDPATAIEVRQEIKRVPRYLTETQVEALLDQPDTNTALGLRDRALIELIYSAGLRISEALGLELGDIDYEQGFIYVRNGKGGIPRSIPIGKIAAGWIQRYIAEGRRKLLQCSCSELVFVSRSGGHLSRQSAAAAIRAYARLAGLPDWFSPHSLRHACATHMLEGGADLQFIQKQLGHQRIKSTQVYTVVRSEKLKAVHASCHPRH